MRFRFALLSLVASAAVAQTTPNYTTTITLASLLSGSAKVPSAQVCATPANAYGNPIAVSAPTWGLILPSAPLCATVVSGALPNGLPVPDANHTNSPSPINYNVTIQTLDTAGKPNAAPVLLNKVAGVSGTTYSLDNFAPTVASTIPSSNTLGGGSGTPSTCTGPSLYLRSDNVLLGCQNGVFAQVGTSGVVGSSSTLTVNGISASGGNLTLTPAALGALPITGGHVTGSIQSDGVVSAAGFATTGGTTDGFWAFPCLGVAPPFGATGTNYVGYHDCSATAAPVATLLPASSCPAGSVFVATPATLANGTRVNSVSCSTVTGTAGTPGLAGSSATVAAGTVTMTAAGTSPTVTNVGTSSAAVFNFTIPYPAGSGSSSSSSNIVGTLTGGIAGPVADGETAVQAASYASKDSGTGVSITGTSTITFDLNADLPATSDLIPVIAFQSTSGTSALGIDISNSNNSLCLNVVVTNSAGTSSTTQKCSLGPGSWHRYGVDTASGYVQIFVDGVQAVSVVGYSGSLDPGTYSFQFFGGTTPAIAASNSGKQITLAKVGLANVMWSGDNYASDFAPGTSVTGAAANTGTTCNSAYDGLYASEYGVVHYWALCERGTNPAIGDSFGTASLR